MSKILLYDLETTPNLGYTWGTYEQNVIDVKRSWELLSVAYKWLDGEEIHCETRQGQKTDKLLTKKLWTLLDKADVVIAHNAVAFDNKKAQAKFIEHGLTPPSPFKTVDTLKIARAHFKFNSNRLNDLGKLLGLGTKAKTEGFDTWLGCMADKPKAWNTLIKYNKQDIALLESVYLRLRPWMSSHPNVGQRGLATCPKCNSENIQRRGFNVTKAGKYQQYACLSCGGWCRSKIAAKGAKQHKIVNG